MKKRTFRFFCLLMAFVICLSMAGPVSLAAAADDEVQAVIDQLNAIDTLQEMQNKRYEYTVKSSHYDSNTTDTAIIAEHDAARSGYETYVAMMFAARAAAQQAYDALTPAQQAQIDPALVAKLDNYLPTVFNTQTFAVTPATDAYIFEAVNGGTGYGYEVSNYMVFGNIPQTFILVDTSDGKTSWTPSGLYSYGQSNYEVTYCCDVETNLKYSTDYKRTNLENSGYFGTYAAQHVRAILLNSYPYVTIAQMKANLKAAGVDGDFVDSLNRADIISAVQMAIWHNANSDKYNHDDGYFASVDVTRNMGIYFTALHDYTNEVWEWLPGKRQRSFDSRAEYRVEALAYYLCNLPGVASGAGQVVISDVDITRAECIPISGDLYSLGLYVNLNAGARAGDDLTMTITSYSDNGDGTVTVTDTASRNLSSDTRYPLYITAKVGDTISVVVEGTQIVDKNVYFYEPKGGRDESQSLVGVGDGETAVYAMANFSLEEEAEMGLRIYKTEKDSGLPISDIKFHVYSVDGQGGTSEIPTEEEIALYAVPENLIGTIVTDTTGYGSMELDEGTYLVVEEYNAEKIKAPVAPFYIQVPMPEEKEIVDENGNVTTEIVYNDIVTVYPKNEPVVPPPPPPPPPPDNEFYGKFNIWKHETGNTANVLAGAEFAVYRTATAEDTDAITITCDGVEYSVVPYIYDGAPLKLVTDENGFASSPEINCGVYFVVETKAPSGYVSSKEVYTVTVTPSVVSQIPVLYIANDRGSLLPETGGEGVVIMLGGGALLAIAAFVVLLTRRRMVSVNVNIDDDDFDLL